MILKEKLDRVQTNRDGNIAGQTNQTLLKGKNFTANLSKT
jgi:hypothetical protein